MPRRWFRRLDSDRPIREIRWSRQAFNRALERRNYSNGDMPNIWSRQSSGIFSPAGAGPRAGRRNGLLGADCPTIGTVKSWINAAMECCAVDADDELQQLRRLGGSATNPAPTPPGTSRTDERRKPSQWFNTAAGCAIDPRVHRWGVVEKPVRGQSYRDVRSAVIRRVPVGCGERRSR